MAASDGDIAQLLAKQEITEVIFRYARAIDRLDEEELRSVFHPESRHSHFYEGPSSDPSAPSTDEAPGDFVAFAISFLSACSRTHHQLGNTLIQFDSDAAAKAETYFTAYHRMRARGDPLAADNAHDTEMDFLVGGRYLDHFALQDGHWKIVQRTGMTDWMRLEPPSSQGFDDIAEHTIGKRAPHDLVCDFYRK
ncbi:MAG: nuclear transport factor 2 family protein [Pseudomonadota bacterium]